MIRLVLVTILCGILLTDVAIYHTRKANDNDCMITYIESGLIYGTIYEIDGRYHIQADRPSNLARYEVGHTVGCTMYSDTIISSLWNTQACYAFKALIYFKG